MLERYIDPKKRAEVKEATRRKGMQYKYENILEIEQVRNAISLAKRQRRVDRKKEEEKRSKQKSF